MRYTLLMHYAEPEPGALSEEDMHAGQEAMGAYAATLHRAGVLLGAEVLQPTASTTTVTTVDGEVRIQDGPFADTKEQLAGTFVLDVANLDEALRWAKQAPPLHWGAVEIRPGATHTVDGAWTPNS